MNDLGPPPFAPAAPAVPNPPASYRAGGLIPPAGAARTWGLTVLGVPLVIVLLLGLVDGAYSGGGGGAQAAQPWSPSTASSSAYTYTQTPSVEPTPYGASDPTSIPTPTDTDTDTDTDTVTPTPTDEATPTAGPETVVTAYFAAINNREYQTAWDLGGKNLGDPDYDAFVAGYATTQRDSISQVSVQGTVVTLVLNALQTDGTSHSYHATYTVLDGVITHGTATLIG
ncbi:hypothetical protein [Streptomyces sp. NPDC050548]|uniref:hypothetical protein n=1 Tax=Streptomyces sp. NPDC050548 TaxID=3365629 RepID=UPI0037BAE637